MKKALALILAGVLAVGMSTVALASDYTSGDNKPSNNVASSGSVSGTNSLMPASSVTESFVEDLGKSGSVFITKDATIDADAIETIKSEGKSVTFKCNEDGYSYNITLASSAIKDAQDLSLGLGVAVGNGLVEITPKMKGDFGLSMTISFSMDEIGSMINPKLYYIDDDGSVYDYGAVKVNGNTVTFAISHASTYVVTDGGFAGAEKVANPATLTATGATVNPDTGAMDVTPMVIALLAVSAVGVAVSKKVQ